MLQKTVVNLNKGILQTGSTIEIYFKMKQVHNVLLKTQPLCVLLIPV